MFQSGRQRRILVVAAHPDDEVLGCGGTLARLAEHTCHILMVLVLSKGLTARGVATAKDLIRIGQQTGDAHKILGVTHTRFLNFNDNRFTDHSLLDVVKCLEQEIGWKEPDTILTHSNTDLNIDHRTTFQAVLTAIRPLAGITPISLYSFYIPSSTDWALGHLGTFQPNTFVDISTTLETKLRAMECYGDEMRKYPHPRSEQGIRANAAFWGMKAGLVAAEPFQLIRQTL